MTLTVTINIAADESGNFTALEAGVLAALQGNAAWPPAEAKAVAEAATPVPAPAPAPKTRAKARPKAAPVEEVPMALDSSLDEEPEVEAPAEEAEVDLLGGEEEAPAAFTKDDALAAATKLISSQKQSVVKAALAEAAKVNPDVKRVSDLNDDASIAAFMAALEG